MSLEQFEQQKIYEAPNRPVYFNPEGLSSEEAAAIIGLAVQLFDGAKKEFKSALERCTFFADSGYDILAELVKLDSRFSGRAQKAKMTIRLTNTIGWLAIF